jgi:glycosyltransferase involved in cell wall biosynthesis
MKPKLVRITTVPISMNIILKGQLGFMNDYFEVIGISSYDEKHLNEVAKREGIRIHVVEMPRTISPIKDLIALWKLIRFFNKEKPTIVHTHTPKAGLLGMFAAYITRVPVRLHTVAGLPLAEVTGIKRQLLNSIEKITYSCSLGVYANSKGLKSTILKYKFCKEEKIKVLGNGSSNGINTSYFSPNYLPNSEFERKKFRKELDIQENEIVFCFVGRIAIEKGIVELLDVFEELQKSYTIKLLLIGTFEKHYGILSQKVKYRIEHNNSVLYLGRFDDVRPFYSISDVYAFPSYREGFPNSVLEACSMSLPCIVSNINGCNEIIEDSKNGIIISPKDRKSLREAMVRLIINPKFRMELASNARPHIEKFFKREVIWDELLNEYKTHIENIK